jgi:hypothetical protein
MCSPIFHDLFFFIIIIFFNQEWTPHILRFLFLYTAIVPAAPQETVRDAGIEPRTAALQSGVTLALSQLSHHIPYPTTPPIFHDLFSNLHQFPYDHVLTYFDDLFSNLHQFLYDHVLTYFP